MVTWSVVIGLEIGIAQEWARSQTRIGFKLEPELELDWPMQSGLEFEMGHCRLLWISQKRCKLELPNFHCRLPWRL